MPAKRPADNRFADSSAAASSRPRAPSLRGAAIAVFLFAAFIWVPGISRAQSSGCDALRASQRATYGFEPLRLSEAERTAKSQEMDRFWEAATALGPDAVPCLQEMLAGNKQDPFFLYDGSALLFRIDKSPASLAAISAALAGTELKDVQTVDYLRFLIKLARLDVDIGPLAAKYMAFPSVVAYLPQHGAMKLDRVDAAMLLYGSMKPEVAEKYLESIATGSDSNARPAAIFALALNFTEASFRALHAGIPLEGLSANNEEVVRGIMQYTQLSEVPHTPLSRDQVLRRLAAVIQGDFDHIDPANPPYVAGDDAFDASAGVQLTPPDIPVLEDARRKSVRDVSDESLDEYVELSRTILQVINRHDLYKKWRTHLRPQESQ
jgi:hypothetical protein